MGMRYVARHETIVRRARLSELERKERAHDVYVGAVRAMTDHMAREGITARVTEWQAGWLDCTRTFAEYILTLTALQMEADDAHT